MASTDNSPKFLGNLILRGKIECITGLHIGGSKDKLEIGGVDSPVIRNPQTRYPYIPGSSLKGKMRHLLEYGLGVVAADGDVSEDEKIVRLFGIGAKDKNDEEENADRRGPARLVVRDCNADEKTIEMWENLDSELQYTEYKPENSINRLTSAANPRFIERVTAGSEFEFEIIYTAYDMGDETNAGAATKEDIKHLKMAMRMLEHNFLGKAGSRGYGRMRFKLADPIFVKTDDYIKNSENYKAAVADLDDADLKHLQFMNDDAFDINVTA